jgi:hypothetical protein
LFRSVSRNIRKVLRFFLSQQRDREDSSMPAKSKAQQKAAGAALAAKRGDAKISELRGASKSMEKSMSERQLEELAATKRKGKPDHAAETKA